MNAPDLFQQQMAARSANQGKEDPVNEGLHVNPRRAAAIAGKLVGSPINPAALLENGGIQQGLESEGIAGKPIMAGSLLPDARGGVIAKLIADIFKNRDITDLTGGIEKMAWADVPEAMLGELSPTAGGGISMERGSALDLA